MASELLSIYNQGLNFVDIDYIEKKYREGYHLDSEDVDISFLAEIAVGNTTKHPQYGILGGRLMMHQLHLKTSESLIETYDKLEKIISLETVEIIKKHEEILQEVINYDKDFDYDFFAFKTLERTYLLQGERPQHMIMRISIGIHGDDIERIVETYQMMSEGFFTHATPTMINAGTKNPQMSSCFLVAMKDDSIDGIFDTLKDCAKISKTAGGIGLHVHNIRSAGSRIEGTNGNSNGLVPMLRVFNNTARYVDQCLHPSTLIYTIEGLKEIRECRAGKTIVFTTRGSEVIKDVLEFTHEGEMLVIYFEESSEPMVITDQHLVSVCNKWLPAGDLKVGDEVFFDSNFETETHDLDKYSDIDLIYYGIMITCGVHQNCYCLTPNEDVREFLIKYFQSKCVKIVVGEDRISWERNLVIPFRYSDFSHGINAEFYNLPKPRREKIISGILISNKYFDSCMTSIKYLLNKNGLDLYGGKIIEKKITNKIKQIKKINYSGPVYDLQMEKTHNYFTINGLVHNGGGKRKGAFAIYLEPWHPDIYSFLLLKKSVGAEDERAKDLFYGLWIPDLFMKRVKEDSHWTLLDPHQYPGLSDSHSEEFEKLYTGYEDSGAGKRVSARHLWSAILESQIETGTPYMLYKDACNKKSNQQNLGTIKSSNLCTEIIQYSSPEETAVCNLASIALSKFVGENGFDFELLFEITRKITYNLNRVIDRNMYPIETAKVSNMRHRPIGIGVQGLADVFAMMRYPFASIEAKKLNEQIFETIYFAACTESVDLAKRFGPYESFKGSPASKGLFQFDFWNTGELMYDWENLRSEMIEFGLRNSLMVAPMPTASTSQILGNNECTEPFTSNIYLRRVLSGEFAVVNKHLISDLLNLGLWDDKMRNEIIKNDGSVQNIKIIPQEIRELYKTVWEIKMRDIIDMASDRAKFIDQSQSMSLFLESPTFTNLGAMHFYAWEKGLKTGIYYLRSKAATGAKKFTVDCTSCGS